MSDENTRDTPRDPNELTDDELDGVAGGIKLDGLMGESVKPIISGKLDGAVQSDTFPRGPYDPTGGSGGF